MDNLKFYSQEPKYQLEWLNNDMLKFMTHNNISNDCLDKITEWRYRVMQIIKKLEQENK